MTNLLPYLLFIVGLVLLIKGGDWFVDGACGIAHRFNMPEILIGATVVSIGTTLPEVMVSAGGALSGNGSMAYGNAIGSIICNTSLIAAISIAVKPSLVDKKSLKTPVIFFFLAAAIYSVVSYAIGYFSRLTGLILLVIFVIYMILAIKQAFKATAEQTSAAKDAPVSVNDLEVIDEDEKQESGKKKEKKTSLLLELVLLVVGAAIIAIGAKLLVSNGTIIATNLGVPDSVIALTFVALGTSLPELVTAITALAKGSGALSLGNIIGANMFNLVLVSGLSITLAPFAVPSDKLIAGMNASLIIDIPLMLFLMLFLCIPGLVKGKLYRAQGIIMLIIYASYCAFQFIN